MKNKNITETLFPYGRNLNELIDTQELLKILVFGGRGLGKTTFLNHFLNIKQEQDKSFKAKFIEGRKREEAERDLFDFRHELQSTSKNPASILIFDDLDRFCQDGLKMEGSKFSDKLSEIIKMLDGLQNRGIVVLASTSIRPFRMLSHADFSKDVLPKEWSIFWSDLMTNYEPVDLNPWFHRSPIYSLNLAEQVSICIKKIWDSIDPSLAKIWAEVVADLTGSHPALFYPTLCKFQRLIRNSKKIENQDKPDRAYSFEQRLVMPRQSGESELKEHVRRHLEDYLALNGMNRIRLAISALRDSEMPDFRRAYESLIQLAMGIKIKPSWDERQILTDNGLAYVAYLDDGTDEFRIPGLLIKNEILRDQDLTTAPTQVSLESDENLLKAGGRLLVKKGPRTLRIKLSKEQLRFLNVLFAKKGKALSVDDIAKSTEKDSAAVRSVIQRLEMKLEKNGIKDLLENDWGEGYRLGPNPTLSD